MKADRDLDDKISILYQLGVSAYEVALKFGVAEHFVTAALKRTGTHKRNILECKRYRPKVSLRLPEGKR